MIPLIYLLCFIVMLLHFRLTGGVNGPFWSRESFVAAVLLYVAGAMVLSGLKESIAKICAATMMVLFRPHLLIGYVLGRAWLGTLHAFLFLLKVIVPDKKSN